MSVSNQSHPYIVYNHSHIFRPFNSRFALFSGVCWSRKSTGESSYSVDTAMNWEAPIFQTSTSQNRPKPSISPDFHSLGALGSAISIALEPDLGTPRVRGWIELYEAMAQDFDRAVPYRAAVFLAVCRLDALVTGGIPRGNRGKPNGISPVPKMERTLVFFGYNQHEMGCSLENEGPNL